MSARRTYQSLPPRKYPALILVPHGTAIIDGKKVTLLHIERESEFDMRQRERAARPPYQPPPPGKPGRPRKQN